MTIRFAPAAVLLTALFISLRLADVISWSWWLVAGAVPLSLLTITMLGLTFGMRVSSGRAKQRQRTR